MWDGATPITQRGRIGVLARADNPVPSGWVGDSHNQVLTDPQAGLAARTKGEAALLPLGGEGESLSGHKGYGLGTMVEILSASLQSGAFLLNLSGVGADGEPQPFRVGHFFMALDIESFVPLADFKHTTGQILRDLRNSRKAPGQVRIYTAGEKAWEREQVILRDGVPVNPNLQKELKFLQQALGLEAYQFPF
jgi:LDH2 family malate/lactate/ureidoglycolate dehydrogenase